METPLRTVILLVLVILILFFHFIMHLDIFDKESGQSDLHDKGNRYSDLCEIEQHNGSHQLFNYLQQKVRQVKGATLEDHQVQLESLARIYGYNKRLPDAIIIGARKCGTSKSKLSYNITLVAVWYYKQSGKLPPVVTIICYHG